MKPAGILETILYAEDLNAARGFYEGVLGLECFAEEHDRHLFFHCGGQVLLIFNPRRTSEPRPPGPSSVPLHGAFGQGHLCFSAGGGEIDLWCTYLEKHGVAIEAKINWSSGGASIYFRDPAGNSLEFAEPKIWKLPRRDSLHGQKLLVATHNQGKLGEIRGLLEPFGVETISAAALGLAEPEETEPTFAGNARLKAERAAAATGLPALSDDSGLCVDELGGEPGVYSARWAGPSKDFAIAMRMVEDRLQAKGARTAARRKAHFVSALCVAWPDGRSDIFEGRVDGTLIWPPRGTNGFGYDPMFVPEGEVLTFGEMEPEKKHGMSHRARAFKKLIDELF